MEERKTIGICSQSSYDYKGKSNALTGKDEFEVKRIIVVQMTQPQTFAVSNIYIDTEMREDKRESREKKERVQIEDWCGMYFEKKIFDSDVDDWSMKSSVFHKKIFGRENLLFLIEDDKDNVFGGFIKSKIAIDNSICSWINTFCKFAFRI